jgi:hypothetical protein
MATEPILSEMASKRSSSQAGAASDGPELLMGAAVPEAHQKLKRTKSQDLAAVSAFARRVVLWLLPIVVFVLLIEGLFWRIGESWPLNKVIRYQEQHPHAIYSRGLLDQGTFRYKYVQLLRRRPAIIALGSSRVMQFRSEMFGEQGHSFYNTGGLIHSIDDLQNFFDRLPAEAMPKVVILGVDFWWVNANQRREVFDAFDVGVDEDGTYRWEGHATAVGEFIRHPLSIRDLVTHSFGRLHKADAIGYRAQLHHLGFRLDGSKRFEIRVPKTDAEWAARMARLTKGVDEVPKGEFPFAHTDGVSQPLLERLKENVLRLKSNGVSVIAYSPPVVTAWARAAAVAPQQREFWSQYHKMLPDLFRTLDIPFWDVETPADVGADDRAMRDPYHAHETFDVRLLAKFCQDPRVRALFPESAGIAQETLQSPKTNPLYPDLPGDEELR